MVTRTMKPTFAPQQGIVNELDELQLRDLDGVLQSLSFAHLSLTTTGMASATCTTGASTTQKTNGNWGTSEVS